MILILESYNASNCFYSINNPDRIASTWIGNRKIGDVSVHDYMKFEKGEDAEVVYMTGDENIYNIVLMIYFIQIIRALLQMLLTLIKLMNMQMK